MPALTAEVLRALRESRDWDEVRLARELRRAAAAAGVAVAEPAGLRKMIPAWEQGRHQPSTRYKLLYRKVFTEEWGANGAPPDLAMIEATRAHRHGVPAQLPPVDDLLAQAAASGREDVQALAAQVADLAGQVAALQQRLTELEATRPGDGDE